MTGSWHSATLSHGSARAGGGGTFAGEDTAGGASDAHLGKLGGRRGASHHPQAAGRAPSIDRLRGRFELGPPSLLFELNPEEYPDLQFWGSFAAAPDGSGFALVKQTHPDSSARSYLMLMLDWRR